jgi:hypothetical protein
MFKGHQRHPIRVAAQVCLCSRLIKNAHSLSVRLLLLFAALDTDTEISKRKLQDVTEVVAATLEVQHEEAIEPQNSEEIESETLGDEIEFIDKPERQDIEKKLE